MIEAAIYDYYNPDCRRPHAHSLCRKQSNFIMNSLGLAPNKTPIRNG
jgi:hypothetical protein